MALYDRIDALMTACKYYKLPPGLSKFVCTVVTRYLKREEECIFNAETPYLVMGRWSLLDTKRNGISDFAEYSNNYLSCNFDEERVTFNLIYSHHTISLRVFGYSRFFTSMLRKINKDITDRRLALRESVQTRERDRVRNKRIRLFE